MSVLLALDSSTEHMALALVGQGHAAFVDADGGALASQRMVPEAMALLRQAGVALGEVAAIGFGRGPGAFTGLRTACSVAAVRLPRSKASSGTAATPTDTVCRGRSRAAKS